LNSEEIAKEEFFALDIGICVPATLGNKIMKEVAAEIKACIIAEVVNGPTTF
jgi:glutamate dehydrogenase/leucine dehydrogenase